MYACHSIRDRSCWCSYSPRNGIWNCQNFWSPCRAARPTLICRRSWKRWAKSQREKQKCCKCRISHANWMAFGRLPTPLHLPLLQEIRKGLLKAAKTTGAWIFTGGTNTGKLWFFSSTTRCRLPLLLLLLLQFHLGFMAGHYDFYGRPLKRAKKKAPLSSVKVK